MIPGKKTQSAFTLIELLTVIAIIGILAAILIPVVAAVRESARAAVCFSNLRQMGMATLLYADDHNERYPPAPRSFIGFEALMQTLRPYSATERRDRGDGEYAYGGIWRCPSGPANWRLTYLPNPNFSELQLGVVEEPTTFILYRDRGGQEGDEPQVNLEIAEPAWHSSERKYHVVYADAHTESLTKAEMEERRGRERIPYRFVPYPGFD